MKNTNAKLGIKISQRKTKNYHVIKHEGDYLLSSKPQNRRTKVLKKNEKNEPKPKVKPQPKKKSLTIAQDPLASALSGIKQLRKDNQKEERIKNRDIKNVTTVFKNNRNYKLKTKTDKLLAAYEEKITKWQKNPSAVSESDKQWLTGAVESCKELVKAGKEVRTGRKTIKDAYKGIGGVKKEKGSLAFQVDKLVNHIHTLPKAQQKKIWGVINETLGTEIKYTAVRIKGKVDKRKEDSSPKEEQPVKKQKFTNLKRQEKAALRKGIEQKYAEALKEGDHVFAHLLNNGFNSLIEQSPLKGYSPKEDIKINKIDALLQQLLERDNGIKQLNEKEDVNNVDHNTNNIIRKRNTGSQEGIIEEKVDLSPFKDGEIQNKGNSSPSSNRSSGSNETIENKKSTKEWFFGSEDLTSKMYKNDQFLQVSKRLCKEEAAKKTVPYVFTSIKLSVSGEMSERQRAAAGVLGALAKNNSHCFNGCELGSTATMNQTFIGALRYVGEAIANVPALLYDIEAVSQCVKDIIGEQANPWDNQEIMKELAESLIKLAGSYNGFITQYIESKAGKLYAQNGKGNATTINELKQIAEKKLPEVNLLAENLKNAFMYGNNKFATEKQEFVEQTIEKTIPQKADSVVDGILLDMGNNDVKKYNGRKLGDTQVNWLKDQIVSGMKKDNKDGYILSTNKLIELVQKSLNDSEVIKTPWLTKKPMSLRENKKEVFSESFAKAYGKAVQEEKDNKLFLVKQKSKEVLVFKEDNIPEEQWVKKHPQKNYGNFVNYVKERKTNENSHAHSTSKCNSWYN